MRPTTPPWSAVTAALDVLGLDANASWDEVRRAYRDRIRVSHPDVGAEAADADQAATVNAAYAVLKDATGDGARALTPPQEPAPRPRTPRAPVVLRTAGGDVYVQLLEAAHELGDVCYMDPEAGLIQVLLGDGGITGAHLLIEVDSEAEPAQAAFTLETADAADAPQISDVVGRLGALLRAAPGD